MRYVTAKCDICRYEEKSEFGNGMQIPRLLFTVGKHEICDVCMGKVNTYIDHLIEKDTDAQHPVKFADQTNVPDIPAGNIKKRRNI